MTDPNDPSAEELERSPFGRMVRQSLAFERLIASGDFVTEADLEDAEPIHADLDQTDGEVSAPASAEDRLSIETNRQAAPPGAA